MIRPDVKSMMTTLAAVATIGSGGGTPVPGNSYYFSGSGSGDGSSINTAAALNQTNLNAAAAAGRTIVLVGPLTTKARDAARGSDEFLAVSGGLQFNMPVIGIRHPLNPDTSEWALPTFVSTRPSWLLPSYTPGDALPITDVSAWTIGETCLIPGTSNLTVENVAFRRVGQCFKMSISGVHGFTVKNCWAYNIERGIDQPSNIRATVTVTFSTNPSNNDTITIGGNVITLVTEVTNAATQVAIGGTASITSQNLKTYLTTYTKAIGVTASGSSTVLTLSANAQGAAGNGKTIARSGTAPTLSAATFTGGVTITNNNGVVEDFWAVGVPKALFRNMGDSSGWRYERVTMDSGWQANASFPRLWNAGDTAHNNTLIDCLVSNIYDSSDTGYDNGDGFETNDLNYGHTFIRCYTAGATDGGFDLKGQNNTKIDCGSIYCKRGNRNWGRTVQTGGTTTNPKNSGSSTQEYGNGSAFDFVNDYFIATATEPDPDIWNGTGASIFKGDFTSYDHRYVGDGDSVDVPSGRQATLFLLLGGIGAQARHVNCIRNNATTSGVDQPLSLANAGPYDLNGGKWIIYNGDVTAIGCQITTNPVQSGKEGALISIPLAADKASARGTLYQDCTFELDRTQQPVKDKLHTLTAWNSPNPLLQFVAPAFGAPSVTIPILCRDAADNQITGSIVFTSTQIFDTDPPMLAGNAPGGIEDTKATADILLPLTGIAANDIFHVDVYSNATSVSHPTIPGFTLDTALSTVNAGFTPNIKTWTLWKRLVGNEGTSVKVSFWQDAPSGVQQPGTVTAPAVAGATVNAAKGVLIRYASLSDPPYEVPAYSQLGQPNSTPLPWVTANGPSALTMGANRLLLSSFLFQNDVDDPSMDPSTSAWTFNVFEKTTLGLDMTFVTSYQTAPTLQLYTGPKISWTSPARTFSMAKVVAYKPRA